MGVIFKDQGKLEEAIEAYKKAIDLNSNSPELYSNMGVALQDLGKLEEAIEAYKKAIDLNPILLNSTVTWALHSKIRASWRKQ